MKFTREHLKKFVNEYFAGGVTCQAFTDAITDYLEGMLSWTQWVHFQAHLGICLGCRRYLRQMKQTIETLGRIPQEPIPPAIREEILQRFRNWKTRATHQGPSSTP